MDRPMAQRSKCRVDFVTTHFSSFILCFLSVVFVTALSIERAFRPSLLAVNKHVRNTKRVSEQFFDVRPVWTVFSTNGKANMRIEDCQTALSRCRRCLSPVNFGRKAAPKNCARSPIANAQFLQTQTRMRLQLHFHISNNFAESRHNRITLSESALESEIFAISFFDCVLRSVYFRVGTRA